MAGGSLEMTPEQGWGENLRWEQKNPQNPKNPGDNPKKNWKTLRVLRKKTRKKPLRQK